METTISISVDETLRQIYAESAWRVALKASEGKSEPRLTKDNRALLMVKFGEGYDSLCRKIMGYVRDYDDGRCLHGEAKTVIKPAHEYPSATIRSIRGAMEQYLVVYVLWAMYGDEKYSASCQNCVARLLNLLAS